MPFPELPLLRMLARRLCPGRSPLVRTGLVCVQHLIETTGSLFEQLFALGLNPASTFVIGKVYSTNESVADELRSAGAHVLGSSETWAPGLYDQQLKADVRRLWATAAPQLNAAEVDAVIVLDDGGFATASIPYGLRAPVIAVEQTMSGICLHKGRTPCAVVEVASSAAKTRIEPPMIHRAAFQRFRNWLREFKDARIGVAGVGNIGTAVIHGLAEAGFSVSNYDADPAKVISGMPGVSACESLEELFAACDIIVGCSGTDLLAAEPWWREIQGTKVCVSCSSQDREFASVLLDPDARPTAGALDDIRVSLPSGELIVARRGFPVNFDGGRESVPAADIQLTRALLMGGVLHARELVRKPIVGGAMLSPSTQRTAVQSWAALEPKRALCYPPELLRNFDNLAWIERHSGGILWDQQKRQTPTTRSRFAVS